jgi:hypothetical protein
MLAIILAAATGWFLMGPPGNDSVSRKSPISEWINLESFDSAKECEKFANEMSRKVMIQRNKDTKSALFTEIYNVHSLHPIGLSCN